MPRLMRPILPPPPPRVRLKRKVGGIHPSPASVPSLVAFGIFLLVGVNSMVGLCLIHHLTSQML